MPFWGNLVKSCFILAATAWAGAQPSKDWPVSLLGAVSVISLISQYFCTCVIVTLIVLNNSLQADDGNSDMPWKIIKCLSRGPSAITEGRRWVEHDKIFWGRETTFREFYYTLSLQLLCCVMVDSYLLLCRLWAATHHGYIHVRETMIYQEYYL